MKNKILCFLLLSGISLAVHSQVSVMGPTCVLPGIEYQYLITTADTAGTGIHICLDGGAYPNSTGSCIDDSLVSSIRVIWNTGVASATITFNSPSGTATVTVNITSAFQAGIIDSAYQQQTVNYDSAVSSITCAAATGGSCSPSYTYQWQQSADNLTWSDVTGAVNQNLDIAVTLTQTSYFRRKVTESGSNSIGYSNIATVYVNPVGAGSGSAGAYNTQAAPTTTAQL